MIARPYTYLQVLGSLPQPCKLFLVQAERALKRLASAVQLRPWPPYFQSVASCSPGHLVTVGHNSSPAEGNFYSR